MFKEYILNILNMSLVDKSYLSQIISPFIVILTMLVSVLIYIGQKNKDRKESAVRIGDDLERLSEYMAYIHMVIQLEDPKLYDELSKMDTFKLKQFTYEEMLQVYPADIIKKINRICRPTQFFEKNHKSYIKLEVLKMARDRFYYLFNTPFDEIKVDDVHDVLYHEFYRTVLSTMNRWTTFCISMTEGIALENLLFKCMGKNFIEFFTVTYGFIANLNVNTNAVTKKNEIYCENI